MAITYTTQDPVSILFITEIKYISDMVPKAYKNFFHLNEQEKTRVTRNAPPIRQGQARATGNERACQQLYGCDMKFGGKTTKHTVNKAKEGNDIGDLGLHFLVASVCLLSQAGWVALFFYPVSLNSQASAPTTREIFGIASVISAVHAKKNT